LGHLTDLALSVSGRSAKPVEGGHRVDLIACHQIADAALNDDPIVKCVLQLGRQLACIVGGHGIGQSGFDQVAISSQSLTLIVFPDMRVVVEDIEGPNSDPT